MPATKTPTAAAPAAAKRRNRYNTRADGVYLNAIGGDSKNGFHMRWVDPLGRSHKETLRGWTKEQAEEHANDKRDWMREIKREDKRRGALGLPTHRVPIAETVAAYFAAIASPEKASPDTVRNAERYLRPFLQWCEGANLVYLDQLNQRSLKGYHTHCLNQRMRNGQKHKVSTINQWLKPVRAALNSAGEELLISQRAMRHALPHTRTVKPEDRALHGIETARCLDPDELRSLLPAVRAFDARPPSERGRRKDQQTKPAARDITLTLLYGLRRGELTVARMQDLVIAKATGSVTWKVHGKGRRIRPAASDGYTTLGAELLRTMRQGRHKDEWIAENDYETLGWILEQLPKYGGPACSMHDLRATCATYQMCLDIDVKLRSDRLGHKISTAEAHYLHPHPDMPKRAPTLEDAMGIADQVRDIISDLFASEQTPRLQPRGPRKIALYGLDRGRPLPPGKPKATKPAKKAA